MKSLAATLLIFVTCLAVGWTVALTDRAQVTLSASPVGKAQSDAKVTDAGNAVTLAEFARAAQERFRLAEPSYPVAFDDLHPNDPEYAAAQALYPFLHRQLLCPECAPTSSFSAKSSLTRAQAAVALVSILSAQERIRLLTPEQVESVLDNVADADAVSTFARPYIATALADGILVPDAGNMVRPMQPYSRSEMTAAFDAMQRRFPPSAATASLHFASEAAR